MKCANDKSSPPTLLRPLRYGCMCAVLVVCTHLPAWSQTMPSSDPSLDQKRLEYAKKVIRDYGDKIPLPIQQDILAQRVTLGMPPYETSLAAGAALLLLPAGMAIYDHYYSQADLTALKIAAVPPAGMTVGGQLVVGYAACPSSGTINGQSYDCTGGGFDAVIEWGACTDGSLNFVNTTGATSAEWQQFSGQYIGGNCPDIKQVWGHLTGTGLAPQTSFPIIGEE